MNSLVWRVEHVPEVDSTNDVVAERARAGESEGLVLLADHQSRGRGRLGRIWEASPGSGLLCSLLLRPSLGDDQVQWAVAAVALSARAALARYGVAGELKWPNDLVVRGEKIAGILAERVTTPSAGVVVGLGVNLSDCPPDVAATHLARLIDPVPSPRELLDTLLDEVSARRALLDTATGLASLAAEYRGALATIGQRVVVVERDGSWEGTALGVNDAGHLIVRDSNGERVVAAGDVVHLRAAR
ncbi:MAG TPA: biotin--[acetyl-CoA-carboxylase] ligase [Acidimicrobiales bacterium]|nr:biotin--[acetyl-CoA-carboxylase] ligase [Acidimicrobiales bacterium]